MNKFLTLAKDTALDAGQLLKKRYRSLLEVESNKGHDIKLKADKDAEELIRHQLTSLSSFPVLGEEMGFNGTYSDFSSMYWIVDPLDGTANYMKGSTSCCVSIGLWDIQKPKIGVIYNFLTNEMYEGDVENNFATLNQDKIETSRSTDLEQAVYSTGFPLGMRIDKKSQSRFFTKVKNYKKIRMIGSAALSLAHVASGIFDIYEEESIRWWDVAAGLAIVQAAGGVIKYEFTDKENSILNVIAASSSSVLLKEV
jgi:myo-inositol-1(or 4)-monophosphatase